MSADADRIAQLTAELAEANKIIESKDQERYRLADLVTRRDEERFVAERERDASQERERAAQTESRRRAHQVHRLLGDLDHWCEQMRGNGPIGDRIAAEIDRRFPQLEKLLRDTE